MKTQKLLKLFAILLVLTMLLPIPAAALSKEATILPADDFRNEPSTDVSSGGSYSPYILDDVYSKDASLETVVPDESVVLFHEDFNGVPYAGTNPTDNNFVPYVLNETYGADFSLEAVINIASISEEHGRGIKFILRECPTASSGDLELWIGNKGIWACTNGWHGHSHCEDFSSLPYWGSDLAVRIDIVGNTIYLYLNGSLIWCCTDPSFSTGSATNIALDGWDSRYTIKSIKVSTIPNREDPVKASTVLANIDFGESGYMGTNSSGGSFVPYSLSKSYGADYTLEAVINIQSIAAEGGRGVKFILRECPIASSGKLEVWLGANDIWACTDSWKGNQIVENFNSAPYWGTDLTVRLNVIGDNIQMYLNNNLIWSFSDPSFSAGGATNISLDGWDCQYIIKSLKVISIPQYLDSSEITPPLFFEDFGNFSYMGMNPADNNFVPYVLPNSYGCNFTLEAVINIQSIVRDSGRGVKFILRDCPINTSNAFEIWLGANDIWACTDGWKGNGITQNFDSEIYWGDDLTVRLDVFDSTVNMYLNGCLTWSYTDPTFSAGGATNIALDGWDCHYIIKSVKLTAYSNQIDSSDTLTVLYDENFGGIPYSGTNLAGDNFMPYVINGSYGTDITLEAVINITDISAESGRGIKFVLRDCPTVTSGYLEIWLGVADIWAYTDGWLGNISSQGFSSKPYWDKDITIRFDVIADTVYMYLDNQLIWRYTDASFLGYACNLSIGGWSSQYTIKRVRVTTAMGAPGATTELADPIPETGGTIYYVDSNAPDGGNGLSPASAWNSISQINNHPLFLPGDQILFKRDSVFTGATLSPKGYGVEGNPIIVDSYGEGALPIIDRKGEFIPGVINNTSAIILYNQSWWTIRNIQISNHNPNNPGHLENIHVTADNAEFPMRNGVVVYANYAEGIARKMVRGIVFENVLFEGIDTSHGDEGNCFKYRIDSNVSIACGGGALCFRANDHTSGAFRSYMEDITVENCTFHNIGGTALSLESSWLYHDSFSDLLVRNNRFSNDPSIELSGTAIYIVSCKNSLVEHNAIQDMTNGIGFQLCTYATAQYNTIVNVDGYLQLTSRYTNSPQYWDGCGIDADTGVGGATFRFNYTERCREGSFAFFDYNETAPALIKLENNISYNCGSFMYYQCENASYDFIVKNNTVIRLPGGAASPKDCAVYIYNGSLDSNSMYFSNNIFYYPNQFVLLDTVGSTYSSNLYVGIASIISDSTALTGDPALVLPTSISQTQNLSWNGSIAGTVSLVNSGLFRFLENSVCLYGDAVICGADLTEF